jgi:hypothetical protein
VNYLCLFYVAEKELAALPGEALDALVSEHLDHDEELRKSGHLVLSGGLEPVRTAATVRVRSGALSTTDGPFAETREQLGGFVVIEARDLNDAIRIASRFPPARLGCIEVRPIAQLTRP